MFEVRSNLRTSVVATYDVAKKEFASWNVKDLNEWPGVQWEMQQHLVRLQNSKPLRAFLFHFLEVDDDEEKYIIETDWFGYESLLSASFFFTQRTY
jgi:hypothetical protein